MRQTFFVALLLASCGGSHELGDGGTSEPGDDAAVVCCDLHDPFIDVRPFGVPPDALYPGIATWIAPGELAAYFLRRSFDGGLTIMRATRSTRADAFGAAVDVPVEYPAAGLALADDELTLYYRGEQGVRHTTRPNVMTPFAPSEVVIENGAHPILTPAYLYYWLYPDADDAPSDLHRTDASGVDEILLEGRGCGQAAPSRDDDVIYCARPPDDRRETDIVAFVRTALPSEYDETIAVPELTTDDFEVPVWVSPDLCRLYFMRAPALASTGRMTELFVAERVARAH